MTTEYQARYCPPSKNTNIAFTSELKPCNTLKVTGHNISAFRATHIINQHASDPLKTERLKVQPKNISTGQKPGHTTENKSWRKVDYTTVYQNDFRAWKPEKPNLVRPKASTDQTDHPSKGGKDFAVSVNRKPFDGMTTYAVDYVPHPIQPRRSKALPVSQNRKVQLETHAANQKGLEFFQEFKRRSAENQGLHPGDVRKFQAATHKPKGVVTMEMYEKTQLLQERDRTTAGTQPIDSVPNDGSLQYNSGAFLTKSPNPKNINKEAKKCCCESMKKHQSPAETVGSPTFKFFSSMSWSSPLVGEMNWSSLSHT